MGKPKLAKPGKITKIEDFTLVQPEYILGIEHHPLAKTFNRGDIFLSRNPQFIGNLINKVSSFYSVDGKSEYSHSGIITYKDATILEASWTVRHDNLLTAYEGEKVLVGRHYKMSDENFSLGFNKILEHIGQSYPFPRLILHLFNLARTIHWNKIVCSELVGKFLFGAGLFSYKYYGIQPDMLDDMIKRELNDNRTGPKYEIIYEDVLPVNVYKRCTCGVNAIVPINHNICPVCLSNKINSETIILPKLIAYNKSKMKKEK